VRLLAVVLIVLGVVLVITAWRDRIPSLLASLKV